MHSKVGNQFVQIWGGRAISTPLFYGPGVIHQSALLAEADIDGKIITFCPFG
jgi:hypothetical protein